ncbi:hypothetical protein PWG14_20735 (plasmid) [Chromobacterium amazonense]|uniref:hypothetical protein n=1 Tax=Chromobacterium amazonense TaxID=1382803 RepID=UPI00237DA8A3|nr:hypothetical protein [Chromobacterium amazonense]MDE1714918.1 hypothetical protein [Chromobacterium amazonense]
MHASTIQNLVGLCFQMETTLLLKTQHFGQYEPPEFEALTMHEKKAQAAMIMAKINRLPNLQRAVLWALHTRRETEMIYLTTHTPCKYGFKTDLDIIRKWATGKGPGCRDLGDRHGVHHTTLHRYGKKIIRQLEQAMHQAYAALEGPLGEIIRNLRYEPKQSANINHPIQYSNA